MHQSLYIVHGFIRTQSLVEDQRTIDVAILVVDVGGEDTGIIRTHHYGRYLFPLLAPPVPIIDMIGGETVMMTDNDIACRQGLDDNLLLMHPS